MVTCYLAANVMAVRVIQVAGISIFDAGTLVFPFTYMIGEVVTEVWGFHRARRMIVLTFLCQIIFVFFTWLAIHLPYPAEMQTMVTAYNTIFAYVPRIMLASLTAFLAGELTNSYLMARIKQHFGGPLWTRTITSSIFGYTLDTTIFVLIAFLGTVQPTEILTMIGIQIAAKVLIECLASTPLSYGLVAYIQRKSDQQN